MRSAPGCCIITSRGNFNMAVYRRNYNFSQTKRVWQPGVPSSDVAAGSADPQMRVELLKTPDALLTHRARIDGREGRCLV